MTIAVANAIMKTEKEVACFSIGKKLSEEFYKNLKKNSKEEMVKLGKNFLNIGFGPMFRKWIISREHKPYESFGDGAAMRISPVGFVSRNLEELEKMSNIITGVSHNHPKAFKGALVTAETIFLLKEKKINKLELKEYIQKKYYPNLLSVDYIRKTVEFDASCQYVVPQAISCFLESNDF